MRDDLCGSLEGTVLVLQPDFNELERRDYNRFGRSCCCSREDCETLGGGLLAVVGEDGSPVACTWTRQREGVGVMKEEMVGMITARYWDVKEYCGREASAVSANRCELEIRTVRTDYRHQHATLPSK